jgi:NAD(P)-dependent dehydrogenase (short-subunit alcohol dehydrogenase family)
MRLAGKVAVVTGGASGIGAATARLFAREDARVAIFDVNAQAGSGEALAVTCDVTREDEVRQGVERVASTYGPISIVVNNAGCAFRNAVVDQDAEGWDRVLAVNLKGAYLVSKHALAHFAEPGGSIIHMSSVTGITGVRRRAAYSAAKGAIVALTRNMALDYAARRIRVNCVCPGFVRTPFIAALLNDAERTRRLTALHPLGRLGEPDDIANAILFLASDEAAWVTGQALVIDGGFSSGHAEDV